MVKFMQGKLERAVGSEEALQETGARGGVLLP